MALLSYLAQTNIPASRETLAALFWPEHNQSEALKSLRRELARLKKSLGDEIIYANSSQIVITHSAVVDTIHFKNRLDLVQSHDHFPEIECSSCLASLNSAVKLYVDEFMAGFNLLNCPDFDEWQDFQRETLRQLLGHALHKLTIWQISQQNEEQAILYCRKWLALDPLNETVRQILMQVYAQVGKRADALQVYDEGERLLEEELGLQPTQEIHQLYQKICAGILPDSELRLVEPLKTSHLASLGSNRRKRSNLPQQPTPFIGRSRELMMVQLRLQEPTCRLLTLIGPGGIGKTRLALEVGRRILDEKDPQFVDGVFFVPLVAVRSQEGIATAMLEAAGVPYYDNAPPVKLLLDFLVDKKMLFILDNMEHLLESSDLISRIITSAPGVRILATSRLALRLQAEWFHPVGGMSVPPFNLLTQGEEINHNETLLPSNYDSVLLFEQCARNASPDFSLRDELEPVVQICHLVEGMPLALEMAATWLKVMDAKSIANELKQNMKLLTSNFINTPERHQSIQMIFEQTWDMLESCEQKALARLSVFSGGFTREAANQVANADLFLLSNLIEKAFLYTTTHGRYRLHELLRQFTATKSQVMALAEESRVTHYRYYMRLLAELEPNLKGKKQSDALNQIRNNLENIRLAWDLALEKSDLKALDRGLETIYLYFFIRGRTQEGVDFLQTARSELAPNIQKNAQGLWGRILSRICLLKSHLPPDEDIEKDIQAALTIAHRTQNQEEIGFCKFVRGVSNTLIQEDAAKAIQSYQQALQVFRGLNDTFYMVQVLIWLGYCHGNNERLDLYYAHNREALTLARAAGHHAGAANALGNLVTWDFCVGDYAAAEKHAIEVNQIAVTMNLPNMITHAKAQLCLVNILKGDLDKAGEQAHETYALAKEIHLPLSIAYGLTFLGLHASINGDYCSGKRLGEESLENPAPRFGEIITHWAIALACCGLTQDETAWHHIQVMLEMAHQAGFDGMIIWPLPVIAILQAHAGQKELAVQLLGLAHFHPLSPTGWQKQWTLLVELVDSLKNDLGEGRYNIAWEQGRDLDPETVVNRVLTCQGDNIPVLSI